MRHAFVVFWVVVVTASATQAQRPQGYRNSADPFSRDAARSEASDEGVGIAALTEDGVESGQQEGKSYRSHETATAVMTPVQQNAYLRAEQRRQRIAARQWFGLSNSRPVAAASPYFTPYSPEWVGSYWQPYFWYGGNAWR